ncbi:MAG: oxidoreductase, partial [Nostocaceae cyanobacterium]|nr:oxidoreductase [Nostocaceae cyanobacterium]
MLDSIEQIKSPRLRGAAAAGLAFTVVTFISGIVISAVNPKAKVNEVAAPSYLIGMACGAVFGLAYGKKRSDDSTQDRNKTQANNGKAKQDWRNFVVDRKVQESEEITSLYLKSEDKGNIPQFEAGQYITIKLDAPEQKQPVIRTYSISDYPNPCDYYRISIKRELAPKNTDAPTGLASNFMHDHIQTGAVIAIKPPIGQFILDKEKSLPVVLVSNGIGVTPFMSMVKACSRLNSKRTICFVHGARNGQ